MDKLFIEELVVVTTIGVYDWEKNIRQTLTFDIELEVETYSETTQEEDLQMYNDYSAVGAVITHYVSHHQFGLLENVANQVANLLLERFRIESVKICVSKMSAISNAKRAGVIVYRDAKSFTCNDGVNLTPSTYHRETR